MSDLSAYLAATALLLFSVYRLRTDRRPASHQAQRYVYCLLICLALTMALLAPSMPRLLAGLGLNRTAVILVGDSIRTAAMSLLIFMAYAVAQRPVRGLPVLAAVATQCASISLFIAARPVVGANDALVTHGSGRWLLAGYDTLFAGYAEWSLTTATAAFGREASRADAGPVRAGIRLSLAALIVGMVWTAWTGDDVVNAIRTGVQAGSEDLVSNTLGALCAALIVGASLAAKWYPVYAAAWERIQLYRLYRRLAPLWEALRAELPDIALGQRRRARWDSRSLDFALYRRIIEIHDGRLALRPYTPERGPAADDAADEAASIVAALENHRAGRVFATADGSRGAGTSRTVAAEARWLADVATAFTRIRPDKPAAQAAARAPETAAERSGQRVLW